MCVSVIKQAGSWIFAPSTTQDQYFFGLEIFYCQVYRQCAWIFWSHSGRIANFLELWCPVAVFCPKGEKGVFGVFGVRCDLISGVWIIAHNVINLGSNGVEPVAPQLYALLWQCNRQVFHIWMIEPYSHNNGPVRSNRSKSIWKQWPKIFTFSIDIESEIIYTFE